MATAPKFKADMKRYTEWLVDQTEKASGITINLNTEATAEIVASDKADAVIVAVGADPIPADFPGASRANVFWVGDVNMGKAKVGENVVVIGAGFTGSETALQLAKDGKKVTIIDILDLMTLQADWPRGLAEQSEEYGVSFLTGMKVEEITEKGIIVADSKGERTTIAADTVILSLGFTSRTAIVNQFKKLAADV